MSRILRFTSLLILLGFSVAAQNAGAQQNVLDFGDNFIVSGDFAIGGTGLVKSSSGFATGTIFIGNDANGKPLDTNPGVKGTNSVPQGAQIVAALLFWQTVEIFGGYAGDHGFFRPVFNGGPSTGYPITGTPLTKPNTTVYWTGTGCASAFPTSKQLVTYRADVRGLLPQDANGNVMVNGTDPKTGKTYGKYEVTLASQSNGVPRTLGATLVLIYRVLDPNAKLNAIVIYNGTPASTSNMIQKMVGFYDADANPVSKLTYIVGNGYQYLNESVFLNTAAKPNNQLPSRYPGLPPFPGWYGYGGWDNPTWFFSGAANPLKADDSSATTVVQGTQQGCVTPAAIIYSTTVKNTDGDGLLDSWKNHLPSPGYCDAVPLDANICNPLGDTTDHGWVDLTGAHSGQQDVFVQLDYMCSSGDNNTCNGSYDFNPFNPVFGPPPKSPTTLSVDACPENVIQKVVDAFADVACEGGARNNLHQPINLHVFPENAVPEQTCPDNPNPNTFPFCAPTRQPYPNQAGVVGWKGGFAFVKNQLVDSFGHPVPCIVPADTPPNTPPPSGCAPRFQHGKKDSWHYVLFGDRLGGPNWSFLSGTLTDSTGTGPGKVVQTGSQVTFYTTVGHGLMVNANAGNGRVTIADAITNPNLNGTFLVTGVTCPVNPDTNPPTNLPDCSFLNKAPKLYSFTINIGTSANEAPAYTRFTDPNLSIASGLAGTGSGYADVGGQDSVVTLGLWGTDVNAKVIAGTFMHELGHSLGLSHGGIYYDNLQNTPNDYRPTVEANCKANFPSVMTYHYQRTMIDNHALDYSEEWLPNPPGLGTQALNENGASTGFSMFPLPLPFLTTPPYGNTFWYIPFTGVGTAATAHCDGTPIRTGEPPMTITTGASSSFSSSAFQDINFDGNNKEVLRGHSDWMPTFDPVSKVLISPGLDLRQIGATGNLSVAGGSSNLGGGSSNIGGGSSNIGGGSSNIGGGSSNIGGGSSNLGGGSSNIGGGGGDLDRRAANAVTLPPGFLTAIEVASPRTIRLFWFPPGFGVIGSYNIYRQPAFTGGSPMNVPIGDPRLIFHNDPFQPHFGEFEFDDTVICNPTGYQYKVTAVLGAGSPNPGQESGPTNTVSKGQNDETLTGCYAPTGFNLSAPANAVHGSIVSITFTVLDALNSMNAPVNTTDNAALVTLVANGPLPGSCGTMGPTTLVNNGSVTSVVKDGVPAPSGTFASAGGHYTFNWDTDGFCADQYTINLILDNGVALSSHQMATTSLQLSIDVNDQDNPHVNQLALTAGTVGLAYNNTLNEHGGTPPDRWNFTGSLPPGISQQSQYSPTLSGTTCVAGSYNFTAMVTDSKSHSGTQLVTLPINPATTTTSVTSSANPSTYGQAVTFTATVMPQYNGCPPTGSVQFYIDGTAFGSPVAVSVSGTAVSGAIATLTVVGSPHVVRATFTNVDGNFTGSAGNLSPGQTVNPAPTSTTVTSSLNPSIYGQPVSFTAVVSNASSTAVPTGSVQLMIDGGAPIAGTPTGCPVNAPANSTCASINTSSLMVSGSPHVVMATFTNVDGNFTGSAGNLSPGQTVNQAASTTTLMTVSPLASTLGDVVTLTATVMDNSGGSTGTPTGLVTFFDGSTPIGTGTLNGVVGSDQATFNTSLLSAAASPHSITAAYSGDANFMGSMTATATTETVAPRATTVGVSLTPGTVGVGQPSTLTVTVSDSGKNPPGTAGTWAATGTPGTGTAGATSTLFADPMVLVAGGTNSSGTVVANAYIYNGATAMFTAATGNLNTARTGATATLLPNGRILIAGGSSDGTATNALNTAELFNPVTGTFTVAGSGSNKVMTAARFGATATLLGNGQILIAGGQKSGGSLASAELYNPATDAFTATGSLGTARYAAAAVLLGNGNVLIAGGTGAGGGSLNSAELYSGGSFTYSAGTMTASRTGATATLLLSRKVLIAGGSTDGMTALNSAELSDPSGASFTSSASTLNTARFNGTATLLPNGMVLLVGGATGTAAELYDPDNDRFDQTGSLANADQASLTATLLNNDNVLITGLTSGGSPASDAEIYTPSFGPLGTVALASSDTSATPDVFSGPCILTTSGGCASTVTVTPGEVGTNPHTITGTYPADSVHSGNNGNASLTVNPVAPPTNVVATPGATSGSGVVVSWTASPTPGIVSYNVYRGTTSGSETFLANAGLAKNYTDASAATGQTYFYFVTAVIAGNVQSANSNETSATAP